MCFIILFLFRRYPGQNSNRYTGEEIKLMKSDEKQIDPSASWTMSATTTAITTTTTSTTHHSNKESQSVASQSESTGNTVNPQSTESTFRPDDRTHLNNRLKTMILNKQQQINHQYQQQNDVYTQQVTDTQHQQQRQHQLNASSNQPGQSSPQPQLTYAGQMPQSQQSMVNQQINYQNAQSQQQLNFANQHQVQVQHQQTNYQSQSPQMQLTYQNQSQQTQQEQQQQMNINNQHHQQQQINIQNHQQQNQQKTSNQIEQQQEEQLQSHQKQLQHLSQLHRQSTQSPQIQHQMQQHLDQQQMQHHQQQVQHHVQQQIQAQASSQILQQQSSFEKTQQTHKSATLNVDQHHSSPSNHNFPVDNQPRGHVQFQHQQIEHNTQKHEIQNQQQSQYSAQQFIQLPNQQHHQQQQSQLNQQHISHQQSQLSQHHINQQQQQQQSQISQQHINQQQQTLNQMQQQVNQQQLSHHQLTHQQQLQQLHQKQIDLQQNLQQSQQPSSNQQQSQRYHQQQSESIKQRQIVNASPKDVDSQKCRLANDSNAMSPKMVEHRGITTPDQRGAVPHSFPQSYIQQSTSQQQLPPNTSGSNFLAQGHHPRNLVTEGGGIWGLNPADNNVAAITTVKSESSAMENFIKFATSMDSKIGFSNDSSPTSIKNEMAATWSPSFNSMPGYLYPSSYTNQNAMMYNGFTPSPQYHPYNYQNQPLQGGFYSSQTGPPPHHPSFIKQENTDQYSHQAFSPYWNEKCCSDYPYGGTRGPSAMNPSCWQNSAHFAGANGDVKVKIERNDDTLFLDDSSNVNSKITVIDKRPPHMLKYLRPTPKIPFGYDPRVSKTRNGTTGVPTYPFKGEGGPLKLQLSSGSWCCRQGGIEPPTAEHLVDGCCQGLQTMDELLEEDIEELETTKPKLENNDHDSTSEKDEKQSTSGGSGMLNITAKEFHDNLDRFV